MFVLVIAIVLIDVAIVVSRVGRPLSIGYVLLSLAATIVFILPGFFSLQPNQARVLVLFGKYKGTVRESGFHWGNAFYSNGASASLSAQLAEAQKKLEKRGGADQSTLGRNKISLRARTLNGEPLKVNDKRGSPIEIAAVVVWRVGDTAQAVFDVDNYERYVTTQSESAVRHLASLYPYDGGTEEEITLRGNVEEVSQALRAELEQ